MACSANLRNLFKLPALEYLKKYHIHIAGENQELESKALGASLIVSRKQMGFPRKADGCGAL